MPVKFSEEFKRDAVVLVLTQGMLQKQVCADMGISKSALQAWVRNAELAGRGIVPAASSDADGQRDRVEDAQADPGAGDGGKDPACLAA